MLAEGKNLVAGDNVLPVREREELNSRRLLLAGFVSHVNDDLADAVDRGLQDPLYLPHAIVVVPPAGLEEGIHRLPLVGETQP